MKLASTSLVVLCATVSSAALAQGAPPSAEEKRGVEEIVVTATRREARLQDIPVTVTAVTGDALKLSGLTETRQLTQLVPGLFGSRNSAVNQPVIRGVGTSGLVGDEPNVASYIDGVYRPDPYMTNLDLVEIQRIEVLRGPQGTLFGRNATGGLINVITPDPSFDFRGHVSASYGRLGDADKYETRGYVTGGLSSKVAMDLAALYKKNDGYIDDLVRGGKLGEDQYYALRSKLLFRPSDRAQFVLTGEYAKREGESNTIELFQKDSQGALYPGVILPTGPWQASLTHVPALNTETYNVALQTKFDLGAANLETASFYQSGRVALRQDLDSSNINLGTSFSYIKELSFSQEVRLVSNTSGPFQWLAGFYYFWSHLDASIGLQAVIPPPAPPPPPTLPSLATRVSNPDMPATSYAGFGEGTYELIDTVFLTAGLRYTAESRDFLVTTAGGKVTLVPQQHSTFYNLSYRTALRWQFDPKANVYVSYSTGFKSGVYNGLGTSALVTRPEILKAIEGGIKADPTPWLRTNLAIYHYDYSNMQVTARDPVTGLYLLQNAASSEVNGGELEITVAPTSDINLRGNIAYAHGKYIKFPGAQGFVRAAGGGNTAVLADASGNTMVKTPRLTFNIGADWNHEFTFGRLGASVNLYHSSRVYYDFTNNFSQKPYALFNAGLFFSPSDERWRLSVNATNLTNEPVFQYLRVGAQSTDSIRERSREVTATLQYNF